jgi:hypothetical protein
MQTVCFRFRQRCELTNLTEGKHAFQWTPEMGADFQILKEAIYTVPILAYPQSTDMFVVDTDAN